MIFARAHALRWTCANVRCATRGTDRIERGNHGATTAAQVVEMGDALQ